MTRFALLASLLVFPLLATGCAHPHRTYQTFGQPVFELNRQWFCPMGEETGKPHRLLGLYESGVLVVEHGQGKTCRAPAYSLFQLDANQRRALEAEAALPAPKESSGTYSAPSRPEFPLYWFYGARQEGPLDVEIEGFLEDLTGLEEQDNARSAVPAPLLAAIDRLLRIRREAFQRFGASRPWTTERITIVFFFSHKARAEDLDSPQLCAWPREWPQVPAPQDDVPYFRSVVADAEFKSPIDAFLKRCRFGWFGRQGYDVSAHDFKPGDLP